MWSHLKSKKGREQERSFLVEGMRLVEDLLSSDVEVTAVLFDVGLDEVPKSVLGWLAQRNIPRFDLSPRAFAAVADTSTPQGVIAVATLPVSDTPSLSEAGSGPVVVLDGVADPGNVGTLIRSAEAFGARVVVCGTGTVDPYSPKVVRASMGGLFRLPVIEEDTCIFLERWKDEHPSGFVFATSALKGRECDEVDLTQDTVFLIGSEAKGVSKEAFALASDGLRIPMTGAAESLNAAVAGAILLYEAHRQRRRIQR